MGTFCAVVASKHLLRFPNYHYVTPIPVSALRLELTFRHLIGLDGTGFIHSRPTRLAFDGSLGAHVLLIAQAVGLRLIVNCSGRGLVESRASMTLPQEVWTPNAAQFLITFPSGDGHRSSP